MTLHVLSLMIVLTAPARGEPPTVTSAPADSILYVSRISVANLMGVTVTNYGFIGNNFISRAPSMEYPLGSGFEHLVHGGLWVGAQAVDDRGVFVGVTTASLDMTQGSLPQAATEFTPAGNSIAERSILPSSPFYSPEAVSEQDLIALYSDRPARSTSNNPEMHRPLNVLVRQECYAWSEPPYRDVLFFHFVIKNLGLPLANAWVGLFTELASGPKNAYSCWPPATACSSYGNWYSKKWIQYDDSLRLLREHRCSGLPVPSGCQLEITPYWAGVKILTPPGVGQRVTLAAWPFSPGNPSRDQDSERYAIMSAGTIQDLSASDLQPVTGDPVELFALGPFPVVAPGDSIAVDFALLGGAEIGDIRDHARSAQTAYDMDYRDVVVPTLVSLAAAHADPDRVELVWFSPQSIARATVERRKMGEDWMGWGEVSADGTGKIRFIDRDVEPGRRYGYRLAIGESTFGEAWVDVPRQMAFALRGPGSNPAPPGRVFIDFTLPNAQPATLGLVDVTGRGIIRRDVGSLGAGNHMINLDAEGRLAPGVYFVRLVQGGRAAVRKVVVAP